MPVKALPRLVYPALLAVAACWLVSSFHGHPTRGVDDAQILFSYSANLAAGKGLTYANNPERVEGATSLLWTLVCAIPFSLGFDESGVLAISVLLLCLTQVLILRLIRRSAAARGVPSWPFELVYLLAVFSCPSYFTWMSITLMDTCLWGFLVALMVYVALSSPPRSVRGLVAAAIPFFLAPLGRPEAAVVAPAFIALAWLRGGEHREDRRRLVIAAASSFFVSVAAVTIFRMSYFGYPLPNTFYAKVSPSLAYNLSKGGGYLAGFVLTSGPIMLALTFFLFWCAGDLAGRLLEHQRTGGVARPGLVVAPWRLAAIAATVLLIVPVLIGGDHFLGHRFYQPAFPVMVLAVVLFLVVRVPAVSLNRLVPGGIPKYRLATAILLLGTVYWAYSGAHKPSWLECEAGNRKVIYYDFAIAEGSMREGRLLRVLFARLPCYPTVAVTAAGGFARVYQGRIVDLFGLNTPEIAHFRGDRKGTKNHAAFEKEPFFSLPGIDLLIAAPPAPPHTENFLSGALKGLLDDPRFVREWRYGVVYLSEDENGGFEAFYSLRFLAGLERTDHYLFRETMKWSGKWVPVQGTEGT